MRYGWVLVLFACTHEPAVALYGPSQKLTAEDYPDVLERWTRSDKIYKGLENKLFVTATWHAPEFRRAFAVAFPEIYGHGGNVTRRELVDLTGDVEQYHNFFMSIYTPDRKWNDLEQDDSIWRVNLIGSDEVAVDPAEILAVKIDANLRAVYPYISRFDEAYIVRFPLADPMHRMVIDSHSTHVSLRIASALGAAEMRWDLKPSADVPSEPPVTNDQ
jgi:hypothetical protein